MNQDNPIMLVAAARDAFANCYPHPNPSPQGGGEHTECVTTGLPRAQRKCSRPRARTRLLRRRGNGDAAMKQDIPGTIMFDGDAGAEGLALNRMCFSFNSAENRAAFLRDEDAYCAKFGLNDGAARGGQEPQRARADRGRRQRLLPRQARRHFRSQRAGHRRAADRHERSRRSRRSSSRQGDNHGPDHRRHRHDARSLDRQGDRGRASRTIPTGSRSSRASIPCTTGSRARSRTSRWCSTTTTASTSSSTSCRPSRSAPRASTATRTKAGAFRCRARSPGDPALSWHLINALVADEFDITMCQDMLVDHAVTIPMTLMWPGERLAGEDRAGVDQHRAASAALARALPRARPLGRPRARDLPAGPDASWSSAPAGCRTSSTASAPASSTRSSTSSAWTSSSHDPEALTRYSIPTWSSWRARRASSSSTGWRCAAR